MSRMGAYFLEMEEAHYRNECFKECKACEYLFRDNNDYYEEVENETL